jgi:cytochrome P450
LPPIADLARTFRVIEAGSLVIISPWLVHRHRSLWSDPDLFVPQRFSQNRDREIQPGSFIPFGLGPRICTGRALAMWRGLT